MRPLVPFLTSPSILPLLLHLLPLTQATPTPPPLHPRNPTQCDAFSSLSTGSYTLKSNEWGANPSEGSQCSTLNGLNGNSLAWSTNWSWQNDTNLNQVKSFTNVQSSALPCKPMDQYNSISTQWSWSYTGTNLRANVAYDTFLSPQCNTAPQQAAYEVMIWLADYGGISPLSDSGYPPYGPHPTATPTIGGVTWNLILGTNGNTKVFSFVAQQGDGVKNFNADLMAFYFYLGMNQGVDLKGQSLVGVQAGSEVFTGEGAEFVVDGYSIGSS